MASNGSEDGEIALHKRVFKFVWKVAKKLNNSLKRAPPIVFKYVEGREFHLPVILEKQYQRKSFSFFTNCLMVQILMVIAVFGLIFDIVTFSKAVPTHKQIDTGWSFVFIVKPVMTLVLCCCIAPVVFLPPPFLKFVVNNFIIATLHMFFLFGLGVLGTSESSNWTIFFFFMLLAFLYLDWKAYFIVFIVIQTLAYMTYEIITNLVDDRIGAIFIQVSLMAGLSTAALRAAHFLQKQRRILFLRKRNVQQCSRVLEAHQSKNNLLYEVLLPKQISDVVSKLPNQGSFFFDSVYRNVPFVSVKLHNFQGMEMFLSAKDLVSVIHRLFVCFDEEIARSEICHRFKTINHMYVFCAGCPGQAGALEGKAEGGPEQGGDNKEARSDVLSGSGSNRTGTSVRSEKSNRFYFAAGLCFDLMDKVRKTDFGEKSFRIQKIKISCALDVGRECYSCVIGKKQQWDVFSQNVAISLCQRSNIPSTIMVRADVLEEYDSEEGLLKLYDNRGHELVFPGFGFLRVMLINEIDVHARNIGKKKYEKKKPEEVHAGNKRVMAIKEKTKDNERQRLRLSSSLKNLKEERQRKRLEKERQLELKEEKLMKDGDHTNIEEEEEEIEEEGEEFEEEGEDAVLKLQEYSDEDTAEDEEELEEGGEEEKDDNDNDNEDNERIKRDKNFVQDDEVTAQNVLDSDDSYSSNDDDSDNEEAENAFEEDVDQENLSEMREKAIRKELAKKAREEKRLKELQEKEKERVRDVVIAKLIKKIEVKDQLNLKLYVDEMKGKTRFETQVRGQADESRMDDRWDYQIDDVARILQPSHIPKTSLSFCIPCVKFTSPLCCIFQCFPRCPWKFWPCCVHKELDQNYVRLNRLTMKNMYKKYYKQTRLSIVMWIIGYIISIYVDLIKQGTVEEGRSDFGYFYKDYSIWDVFFYKYFALLPPLFVSNFLCLTSVFVVSSYTNFGLTVLSLMGTSGVFLANFYLFETFECGISIYAILFFHLTVEGLPAAIRAFLFGMVVVGWVVLACVQFSQAQKMDDWDGPRPHVSNLLMNIFAVLFSWFFFSQLVHNRQVRHFEEYFIQGLAKKKKDQLSVVKDKSSDLIASLLSEGYMKRMHELSDVGSVSKFYEDVAVMVCKLCNMKKYVELQKHDPTAIVKDLNEIFCHFDNLTDDPRLWRVKNIQGAYVVAAGVPNVSRIAPQYIAICAIEMIKWLETTKKHAEFRIGIHTGPVFSGIIMRERFQLDIFGKTIDLAMMFEEKSKASMIHVSYEYSRAFCHQQNQKKYQFANRRDRVEMDGRMLDTYWLVSSSSRDNNEVDEKKKE